MPQYFIDSKLVINTDDVISGSDYHHIVNVRRCSDGDRIELTDKTGTRFNCLIKKISDNSIWVTPLEKIKTNTSSIKVILAMALLKNKNFELVIQKAVEVGVSLIIPVYTERTIVKNIDENKIIRWQKIASEAAKQCKSTIIPKIEMPVKLNQIINEYNDSEKIISHTDDSGVSLRSIAEKSHKESFLILIGPEGGFSSKEVSEAVDKGWKMSYTGFTVMRAETAGIVIPALLINDLCS